MKNDQSNQNDQPYHHGDLRAALLDAAAEVIATEGIEGVTMRGLAQRLGVSRSAAYRHFADKAALLTAVATEGFQQLHDALTAPSGPTGPTMGSENEMDGARMLQQMGIRYVRFALAHPTHYRLMFSVNLPSMQSSSGDEAAELARAAAATFDVLLQTVIHGQETGALRTGDARQLARVAWANVHGLSMLLIDGLLQVGSSPEEIEGFVAFATRMTTEGMAKPHAPAH